MARSALAEADLRAGVDAGGRIERVVVITRRDDAGLPEHVPYFLPSWCRGYVAISLFRGPGVRTWRDLDRLLRYLRGDMGYALPVSVYEAGCPRLALLRSMSPEARGPAGIVPAQPAEPPALS